MKSLVLVAVLAFSSVLATDEELLPVVMFHGVNAGVSLNLLPTYSAEASMAM